MIHFIICMNCVQQNDKMNHFERNYRQRTSVNNRFPGRSSVEASSFRFFDGVSFEQNIFEYYE